MTETEAEAIRLLRELVQQIEIKDAHLLRAFIEVGRCLAAHGTPRP